MSAEIKTGFSKALGALGLDSAVSTVSEWIGAQSVYSNIGAGMVLLQFLKTESVNTGDIVRIDFDPSDFYHTTFTYRNLIL